MDSGCFENTYFICLKNVDALLVGGDGGGFADALGLTYHISESQTNIMLINTQLFATSVTYIPRVICSGLIRDLR